MDPAGPEFFLANIAELRPVDECARCDHRLRRSKVVSLTGFDRQAAPIPLLVTERRSTALALASSTLGCATRAPTSYSIAGIHEEAAQAYMEDCLKLAFHKQYRYTPAIDVLQACKRMAHGHTSLRQPADR